MIDLPKPDTIRKFSAARPAPSATATPVVKNGDACEIKTATGVHSQWMDITPEMAAQWLKNNFRNRAVSDHTVAAYARDMVNEVWMPTHQGIGFNDRDELIDGQHRLRAIIKAQRTVRMMVTFGLASVIDGREMTTMDCVDRGRTRSVADQLKIQHGLKDGTQIAQVASAIAGLCFERVRRLSVGQTLEIYRTFQAGVDYVIERRSKTTGLRSAGVLGAFAFVLQSDDREADVFKMFEALNRGGAEAFPNIILLREFLTGEQAAGLANAMNRGLAELTVQVIYCELKGKRMEKLEMGLDGVLYFRAQLKTEVEKIGGMLALPKVGAQSHIEEALPAPARVKTGDVAASHPSLDTIFSRVESHFKISGCILTGKGRDAEIDSARIVFIALARTYGHSVSYVAAKLHRSMDWVECFPELTSKQKLAVEKIKAKL